MYIFIYGLLFANFVMIFIGEVLENGQFMQCIRVQKHIQKEDCDVLTLSTWSTDIFSRNRIQNRPFLLTDCCCCLHTWTTID